MNTFDDYILNFPPGTRDILEKIRDIVFQAAPEAKEKISYGMPSYKYRGKQLVYFAAFRNHIGLYATPAGHTAFAEELAKYRHGKGSVQFPLDKPIPYDLIKEIIEFRVAQFDLPE